MLKYFNNHKRYSWVILAGIGIIFIGLFVSLLFSGSLAKITSLRLGNLQLTRTDLVNALKTFKYPKFYIVQSGSMEPAIKTGSVVVSYPSDSYTTGDVITFTKSQGSKSLVTHRIEARFYPDGITKDPVYKTSGDANEDFDPGSVQHSQVVGKMLLTVPYLGYIANYAKQPYGFILFVIVPATIIIYEELKSVFNELGNALKDSVGKLRKKKEIETTGTDQVKKERKGLPKASVLFPVFGASLVIISLSAAFFNDIERSVGNVFQAASSFGEKSASLYNSDPFTCPLGATSTDGQTYGTVILKIENTNLKVNVILSGATANATYDIWVNQDPGGCPLASPSFDDAITTDGSGNGSAENLNVTLVGGAGNFWISAVGGGQVLRSTAVQLP